MNTQIRRKKIKELLGNAKGPLSASSLAKQLSVSRQIIVGDVAILRASGLNITATPRGYVIQEETSANYPFIGILACKHNMEKIREEMYTVVDFGGTLIDVTVEHSLYGQLSGLLNISSRYDVDQFIEKVLTDGSKPLSDLTGGIHLHSIGCKDKDTFQIIKTALIEKGIGL